MKKKFPILAVAMALLMGVTSCNKDTNGGEATDAGSIKISYGFEQSPQSRATTVSSAKPTTTWDGNIKKLQLLLVQGNIVKYVQPLTIPANGTANTAKQTFTGVPAGTFDVYLIANNMQTATPLEATAYAGTAAAINVGTNINTALVQLATTTALPGMAEPSGYKLYKEPSEIFVAKKTGVVITANTDTDISSTPLALTRVVGLVRVLIDNSDLAASAVDFTHANASLRIRRHANAWNIASATSVFEMTKSEGSLISSTTKKFATSEPATGYAGGTVLGGTFTKWMDMICLPGGSLTDGADKFNIIITGHASAGYMTAEGSALAMAGPVYWQGAVNSNVEANGILEIQVKITTPGSGGPGVPPVTEYGTLSIVTQLVPWGNISAVEMPL